MEKNRKDIGVDITDFSALCSKPKANDGVWVRVIINEEPWNVEVKVIGNDSDEVSQYTKDRAREQMKMLNVKKNGKSVEFDDDAIDELLQDEITPALIRFGGIRRYSDKKPLTYSYKGEVIEIPVEKTRDNEGIYEAMLKDSPEISDFVVREASKRENFFGERKKD